MDRDTLENRKHENVKKIIFTGDMLEKALSIFDEVSKVLNDHEKRIQTLEKGVV